MSAVYNAIVKLKKNKLSFNWQKMCFFFFVFIFIYLFAELLLAKSQRSDFCGLRVKLPPVPVYHFMVEFFTLSLEC